MSKTPEILVPVTRQYWHNNLHSVGQVPGFDYDETCQIVSALEQSIKELEEMIKLTTAALTKQREQNLLVLAFAEVHGLTDELVEFLSEKQDNE